MKAIILEDEKIASDRLARMITSVNPNIELVAQYTSIEDLANHLVNQGQPDLLFLDIHVEDGISMELFNILEIQSHVVFTTAYDHYAIEAFRKNALDYLLKPIKKSELKEAIDKARPHNSSHLNELDLLNENLKSRFFFKFGIKLYKVLHIDIAYIYSEHKISYFVLKDGSKIPSDLRLQDIILDLDNNHFFRLNRQVIANMSAVKEMIQHTKSRIKVRLSPAFDKEIVVSTENTPKFKQWLQ